MERLEVKLSFIEESTFGVFLTKRQAEDWVNGNYVKEDMHFLYLKHYREYRDFEDVILQILTGSKRNSLKFLKHCGTFLRNIGKIMLRNYLLKMIRRRNGSTVVNGNQANEKRG